MDREITIVVTEEEARRIDERVAAGEFASASELAHAAVSSALSDMNWDIPDDLLRQLIEEDDADSDPGVPVAEAFAKIRARLEAKHGKI